MQKEGEGKKKESKKGAIEAAQGEEEEKGREEEGGRERQTEEERH